MLAAMVATPAMPAEFVAVAAAVAAPQFVCLKLAVIIAVHQGKSLASLLFDLGDCNGPIAIYIETARHPLSLTLGLALLDHLARSSQSAQRTG